MPLQTTPSALFANAIQTYGQTVNDAARINLAERSFAREIAERDAQALALSGQAVQTEARAVADELGLPLDDQRVWDTLDQRRPDLVSQYMSNRRVLEGINSVTAEDPNYAHRRIVGASQRVNEDGSPTREFVLDVENSKTKSRGPMTVNGTADPDDEVVTMTGGQLLQRAVVGGEAWQRRLTGLDSRSLVDSTKRVSDASVASNNRHASLMRDATLEMGRADAQAMQAREDELNAVPPPRHQTGEGREPEFLAGVEAEVGQMQATLQQMAAEGKGPGTPEYDELAAKLKSTVSATDTQMDARAFQEREQQRIERLDAVNQGVAKVMNFLVPGVTNIMPGAAPEAGFWENTTVGRVFGLATENTKKGWGKAKELLGLEQIQDPANGKLEFYKRARAGEGGEVGAGLAAAQATPGFENLPPQTQEALLRAGPKAYLGVPTERQIKARANMVYRSMQNASPRTESQLASALYMHSAGKLTNDGLERFVSGQAVAPADVRRDQFTMGPDGRLYDPSGKPLGGKDNPIKDVKEGFKLVEDVAGFNRKMAEEAIAASDPHWYAQLDSGEREAYALSTAGIAIQANPFLKSWLGVDLSSPRVPPSVRHNIMRIAAEVAKDRDADLPFWDVFSDDRDRMSLLMQHPQWRLVEDEVRKHRANGFR